MPSSQVPQPQQTPGSPTGFQPTQQITSPPQQQQLGNVQPQPGQPQAVSQSQQVGLQAQSSQYPSTQQSQFPQQASAQPQPQQLQQTPQPGQPLPPGSAPPQADPNAQQPAPDPMAAMQQTVGQLAGTVNQFVEAQQAVPQQQAPPVQAAPPPPPPIQDISDADLGVALEEGGQAAVQAWNIRQNASTERQRREMDAQLQAGQNQLNQLSHATVIEQNEYYKNDAVVRQKTDALVSQFAAQGIPQTAQLLNRVLLSVVGEEHERLTRESQEAYVRRLNEQQNAPPMGPGNVQRQQVPQSNWENPAVAPTMQELGAPAQSALQVLDNYKGRTLDGYAQNLPPRPVTRIVTDDQTGQQRVVKEIRRYTSWQDLHDQYQANQTELAAQQQRYYGPWSSPELGPMQ